MKADRSGSCAEQARFHVGFGMASKEKKAKGKICKKCRYYRMTDTGEKMHGSAQKLKPSHFCDKPKLATRPTAICTEFE